MSTDTPEPNSHDDQLDTRPRLDPAPDSRQNTSIEHPSSDNESGESLSLSDVGARTPPTATEQMQTSADRRYRIFGPLQPMSAETAEPTADTATGRLPRGPDSPTPTDADPVRSATSATESADEPDSGEAPRRRDVTSWEVLPKVCESFGADTPDQLEVVRRCYDTVYDKVAPFVVNYVAEMLPQWKSRLEEDPDHRFVFLGRDGYSLAAATMALDPDFYISHCSSVVVTRYMVETAMQDDETNAGRVFDLDETFRKYKHDVSPQEIHGARMALDDLLEDNDVPIKEPGRAITVIDTSRKGSTQEGLTALYPDNRWQGDYLFFEQSPADPNPHTKTGYALHLLAPDTDGSPKPEAAVDDRDGTLAQPDAALAIEDLLHGPWSSAKGFVDGQPNQWLEPPQVDELNPLDVPADFRDPTTRIAAAEAMVLAVRDRADEAAHHRDSGKDWRGELNGPTTEFVNQLGSWISGENLDPELGEKLAAFARRTADRPHITKLRAALTTADLDSEQERAVWLGYRQADSPAEKEAYVRDFLRHHTQP